ncbi:hypothetical protein [Paenibacillus pinistramenti]|uniref:hypothetical protein n=1 Tax=Paenibacillus pinistramenti TaxID=1768003 RepID=UPI0011097935|nr:hypothetical protein [Paenibacillus pinistramenti]
MNKGCCPPADPIVLDPVVAVQNFYHPQLVPVIQPVQIVHKHHCVPVYQPFVTYNIIEAGPSDTAPTAGTRAARPNSRSGRKSKRNKSRA